MSISVKGTVLRKLSLDEILATIHNILPSEHADKICNYINDNLIINNTCGYITIPLISSNGEVVQRILLVHYALNSKEYMNSVDSYAVGCELAKSKILNYGSPKDFVTFSLGYDDDAVDFIKKLMKSFGGIFVPNDCNNVVEYIEGVEDLSRKYSKPSEMPTFVLESVLRDLLTNSVTQNFQCVSLYIENDTDLDTFKNDALHEFAMRSLIK